jgi:HEPN domain-containing protein
MTKDEHIKYWIETAEYDWKIVLKLFDSKDYLYSLFFSHLTIEKLSKAIWVKFSSENYPPKTHNILFVLEKVNYVLSEEQKDILITLNNFQLEGRYPDYKKNIYKLCTEEYTNNLLKKIKDIKECLLKSLQ